MRRELLLKRLARERYAIQRSRERDDAPHGPSLEYDLVTPLTACAPYVQLERMLW
jgi:hypothetical protein